MKSLLKPTLLLLATTSALAQQEPGSHRFSTRSALTQWATEGSFGGGREDLLTHRGLEIIIVNHAYTAGGTSSGIAVFVKRETGWVEALRLGAYWLDSVEFKQRGDVVILRLAHSGQEILRFSITALHRQFDDGSQRDS